MPVTQGPDDNHDPVTAYVPSPELIKLITDIANAPTLEARSLAGTTLATTMASNQPSSILEEQAIGYVRKALSVGHTTRPGIIGSDEDNAFDDVGAEATKIANLMLAIMTVDDVGARRVALEAIVRACVRSDAAAAAVAHAAIRRFIGWVGQENRTHH